MSDAALAATAQTAAPAQPAGGGHKLWHDGGFGFKDLLDIVNPLQHIPIIGSIYRWATGDEPSDGARIIGDGLYGGPIGLAASAVLTIATEDSSGHDLGEQVLAGLFGPGKDSPTIGQPVEIASAALPTPAASAAAGPTAALAPTAAATAPAPAAAPVKLDHPPIPLFRGAQAPAAPAPQPPAPAQDPAAQAFLAQTTQLQRQLSGGRSATAAPVNNHVIPLELTGNPLAARPFQMPTGKSVPVAPVPAAVPASTPDITQKMLEALDKYKKLREQQEQQEGAAGLPGSAVDLSY